MMKTFLAVFFGILAAVAVLLVGYGVLRWNQEREHAQALERSFAPSRMRTISTACIVYQSTYGGYPERLAQLGPPPSGGSDPKPEHAGLIDSVLASGKVDHYIYSYEPGKRDKKGRVLSYAVTATREKKGGSFLYNYFVDESMVIRSTMQDRAATAADGPMVE